jgi:hypothetical protein
MLVCLSQFLGFSSGLITKVFRNRNEKEWPFWAATKMLPHGAENLSLLATVKMVDGKSLSFAGAQHVERMHCFRGCFWVRAHVRSSIDLCRCLVWTGIIGGLRHGTMLMMVMTAPVDMPAPSAMHCCVCMLDDPLGVLDYVGRASIEGMMLVGLGLLL